MNNDGSYKNSFPRNAKGNCKTIGGSLTNMSKSIMHNLNRIAFAFAVLLLTLTPAMALTNASHQALQKTSANVIYDPTAVFKSSWIDYNVTENGRRGMRIHVKFEVTGLKNVDSKLVARVQQENGDFLSNSSSYSNENGELETSYPIKPGYQTTEYEDAEMFLPYSEIKIRKGVWNLKLDIDLNYENGDLIQHLGYKNFEFSAPNYAADASNTNGTSEITTKVNRVWVDYDVFQNRKKGMRIHVSFEVTGLKEVDSKLTVRVRREDESFLISNSSFSNENGELELTYDLKPGYETTVYKDATVFLPYDEIVIRKGVWNLKLDIDLNYENGNLIEHLTYHEFEFTR